MEPREEKLIRKVREIATFADAFQVILQQNRRAYPRMDSDWLQGLQFYLHGYAFERQGRSPEYSPAAVEAVRRAVGVGQQKPDPKFPQQAWGFFLQILGLPPDGKGANPRNNPLFPSENASEESAPNLIMRLDDYDYNLTKTVLALLKHRTVEDAHTFLCQIRGTGSKINSLFLRDIVHIFDVPVNQYHPLLQPVDIWVRRLTRLLVGLPADIPADRRSNKDAYSKDGKVAEKLAYLAKMADVPPLALNQGAWYLGAQILGTKSKLAQYVEDTLSPRDVVGLKITLLEEEVKALRGLNFRA